MFVPSANSESHWSDGFSRLRLQTLLGRGHGGEEVHSGGGDDGNREETKVPEETSEGGSRIPWRQEEGDGGGRDRVPIIPPRTVAGVPLTVVGRMFWVETQAEKAADSVSSAATTAATTMKPEMVAGVTTVTAMQAEKVTGRISLTTTQVQTAEKQVRAILELGVGSSFPTIAGQAHMRREDDWKSDIGGSLVFLMGHVHFSGCRNHLL